MLKSKVVVYVKSGLNTQSNLGTFVMKCNQCREMMTGEIPECSKGVQCKLEAYIAQRLPETVSSRPNATITELVIPVKSVEAARKVETIVNRAIKLRTHQIFRGCK